VKDLKETIKFIHEKAKLLSALHYEDCQVWYCFGDEGDIDIVHLGSLDRENPAITIFSDCEGISVYFKEPASFEPSEYEAFTEIINCLRN